MDARSAAHRWFLVFAVSVLGASSTVLAARAQSAAGDSASAAAGATAPDAIVDVPPAVPAPSVLERVRSAVSPSPTAAPGPGELVIANRPIVTFRAPVFGYSPQLRAEAAAAQIHNILARDIFGPVESRAIEKGILITVGGTPVFRLLPGDVDAAVGQTSEGLRAATVANLSTALGEVAEAGSVPRLVRSAGRAAVATAICLLLALIVRWPVRRLRRRLQAFAAAQVARTKVSGFTLVSREHVALFVERILLVVKWLVLGVLAYGWLSFVLSQFPYTRPWGAVLGGRLAALAAGFVRGVVGAVPGLLIAAVIFGGMHWVQKILGSLFDAAECGRVKISGLYPDTVPATRRIASALLWLFALALAYPYLPGASSAAFQGVTVFAGLMLSLGSSTLIGQLLSGFMLIYSRTFRVGDYVRIGDVEGVVLEIGHFSTKIRTNAREQVAIPNAVVLGQEAKNYSLFAGEHGVLTGAKVTIGYGAPWRQVHAMLLQAAERTAGLKKTPPPFVLQTALDDWYVTYQVFAYLERPETRVFTLAVLHENIQDAFNEHGVQIMSPHYMLDPAAPVVVPRDRWHMPPAREKGAAGDGSPS